MDAAGGSELLMPVVNSADLWKETGRYGTIGGELVRFKDRKGAEFVLAMTHEEVVTDMARHYIKSYKDMPFMVYQIQTKIRDEIRPRGGLIRVREFIMKDAYSFHPDEEGLEAFYPRMYTTYDRIFRRCGLTPVPIEADSGIMGGSGSHEFMLSCDHGEDVMALCDACDYRANLDKGTGRKPTPLKSAPDDIPPMEKVHTPDVKTIQELTEFFSVTHEQFLKSVAYLADGELVIGIIRGDFEINEAKLTNLLKCHTLELADEAALSDRGIAAGFISPVGIENIRILIDETVLSVPAFIAGANETDYHFRHVAPGRDFPVPETVDIAQIRENDPCGRCEKGRLHLQRCVELGHTFKLGTKYTDAMQVTYLDEKGDSRMVVMGCYGLGIERLMAGIVEACHDEAGIIWPAAVAPADIYLLGIGKTLASETVEAFYDRLRRSFSVIYDERDESPGTKFKDADLIGLPLRVVVSEKHLANDQFELKVRKTGDVRLLPIASMEEEITAALRRLKEEEGYFI
jgi:prolyl-tRNA synthetase